MAGEQAVGPLAGTMQEMEGGERDLAARGIGRSLLKGRGTRRIVGCPVDASVENAEQVQQDDHEDRHAGHPQDDVAKHGWLSFQVVGVVRRR